MTSFFFVLFTDAKNAQKALFDGFFWKFDPLNVVGHRADPKKALPWVIARNLSYCA